MFSENLKTKARQAISTQRIQHKEFSESDLRELAQEFGWKMAILPADKKKGDRPKLFLADKFGNEANIHLSLDWQKDPLLQISWDYEVEDSHLIVKPVATGYHGWNWVANGSEFLKIIFKSLGMTRLCVSTEPLVQLAVPSFIFVFAFENWVGAGAETAWMEVSEAKVALEDYYKTALEQVSKAENLE